jgi:hypothetical protein
MATAVQSNTQWAGFSYISLSEYKNAPTAIDYDNLVVGGTQAQQDAELSSVIARASSWIDVHCNQTLVARSITETKRTRTTPQGNIIIHPDQNPLLAVTAFSYGSSPTVLTAVADPSVLWLEQSQFIYPVGQIGLSYSSQGPLAFGFPPSARSQIYVKYSYVGGYVNTTCSGTVGASSIVVTDNTGILAGGSLAIYDGSATETVSVATSYVYGSSTTIPLQAPLLSTHLITAATLSGLPAAIKQAAILVTTDFLKIRGDGSLTMGVATRGSGGPSTQSLVGSDLALAKILLQPFRRVF